MVERKAKCVHLPGEGDLGAMVWACCAWGALWLALLAGLCWLVYALGKIPAALAGTWLFGVLAVLTTLVGVYFVWPDILADVTLLYERRMREFARRSRLESRVPYSGCPVVHVGISTMLLGVLLILVATAVAFEAMIQQFGNYGIGAAALAVLGGLLFYHGLRWFVDAHVDSLPTRHNRV